ncbi:MAG: glycosyl hydrolase, partial [Gemmatimonadetes bacterium]|nr:glycosyl hydrolase [Gemmatimonadota bacterium]
AGLNRLVWDLRYPGPVEVPGAMFRRYEPKGPLAPPGRYDATLTLGGESRTVPFEIVKDPRLEMTQREFKEKHEFLLRIRDKISETHRTVLRIRAMREELEKSLERAGQQGGAEGVLRSAEAVRDELYRIEEQLMQIRAKNFFGTIRYPVRLNDKLSTLFALVEMADSPPTVQDGELFRDLSARVDEQIARLEKLVNAEWKAFQANAQAAAGGGA